MDLETFLSDSLVSIANGVDSANKKLQKQQFVIYNIRENVIEFDVAVTVFEGKTEVVGGSIDGGFPGLMAKVFGKQSSLKSDKNVSRIKFRVKPRLKIE